MSLMILRFAVCLALAAGLYAVIGGSIFYVSKLQDDIRILTTNNLKLETSVQHQNEYIETLETARKNAIISRNVLSKDLAKAEEHRQIITQELNSFRGRLENAALKKPKLIERHATDALNGLMLDITEETGSNYSPKAD